MVATTNKAPNAATIHSTGDVDCGLTSVFCVFDAMMTQLQNQA